MKKLLLFLFCIPYLGITQNSYIINTVGSTFSPSSLTINVGDTVTWNNTAGFHNINATQATFASNPEGFGNSVAAAGWSFQWIFTLAGTYDYQCDPHAGIGMSGVIIANALPIPGCTNPIACNYDSIANIDDGSCVFLDNPVLDLTIGTWIFQYDWGCDNTVQTSNLSSYNANGTANGSSLSQWSMCGNNYSHIYYIDSTTYTGTYANGTISGTMFHETQLISGCFTIVLEALGCTDSTALNYNPIATTDDSSCTYPSGNLFISEYAEGTSYNKYIEIYNGTGSAVDLSDYDIWKITNGGNWPELSLSLIGTLANNEVYIICSSNSNVNVTLLNIADTLWSSASWNGDDAVGLAKNGVLIDAVGNGVDPGIAWDVAGVVEATKDHTLIRKCSVTQGDTNWIASAGVDSLTSQWLVYPQDYWIDIDQHSGFCGCTDPLACNYYSLANTDDGSCAYDVIWQQNEIICNGDSVMVGSNIYYLSGSYTDSLSTIYGCDSTVYTTLTVNNATDFQQSIILCEGDSLVVGSNTYYNMGNYSDTLTTISGCDSIILSDLDFYQQIPLIIQSEPNLPEICLGDTILLEASAGFFYYVWANGMTGQIIYDNPIEDTWYMVEAVDTNGCVAREDVNVYVDSCITALNEISVNIDLKVYPNPASDKVSILFSTKTNEMKFVEVINTLGKIVNEYIIYNNLPLTIDVAVFTAGTYVVNLKDNKGRTIQTKRLFVD